MSNVIKSKRVIGIRLDVSPSWWRELDPVAGLPARLFALRVALTTLRTAEAPLIEVHLTQHSLVVVVEADFFDGADQHFAEFAGLVVAAIEHNIEIEDSDRKPVTRSPYATLDAFEQKLAELEFVRTPAPDQALSLSIDPLNPEEGAWVWNHPTVALYVRLTKKLSANGRAELGSANANVPGVEDTFDNVIGMLERMAENRSGYDVVPGSVLDPQEE